MSHHPLTQGKRNMATERASAPPTAVFEGQNKIQPASPAEPAKTGIVTEAPWAGEPPTVANEAPSRVPLVFWALLLVALVWAYWPPLGEMVRKWINDPQYSHAYFVPAFSVVLVWLRRKELAEECTEPAPLSGLGFMFLGVLVRLAGAAIYMDWLEAISLLPVMAGAVLVLWGWEGLGKTWYAVLFLFFMVPLPYRVEMMLSHPMQRLATTSSTYLLQLMGFPAFAEGNVILLNDERIGVIEACNGLGMLILFFALATGVAILINKPLLDRVLIILSAAPIAIVVNTLRITVTSILFDKAGARYGEMLGHNQGWVMMPMALALLWVVVKLIGWVLPEEDSDETESPLELLGHETKGGN